jgi:steroid 5-alpha reductase family enzyme
MSLLFMLGVMAAAWTTQRALKNAGCVDVFWTFGTGLSCVTVALWPAAGVNQQRQLLIAAMALIWSLRLGLYVALRVSRNTREDVRYAVLREDWGDTFQLRMLALAIIQAPATALLAWSVMAATHASAEPLGPRDVLGVGILAIAIGGEALADEQMRRFKAKPGRGAINDSGLWAWSRHPNYFFEWFGWLAYPALSFDPAYVQSWPTCIAPALMYLVLRYGTGVPALEHTMLKSRGDAFRAYQHRVSAFLLRPPKRTTSP